MGIMGKWERCIGGRSKPMSRQRTQEALRRAPGDSEVDRKEKPWAARWKASLIATCLVALPALVFLAVGGGMPSAVTVLVRGTTPTSAGQGGGAGAARAMAECDVSRGRWVREPRGPSYTNVTCSTVADYVNCQKFGKDPGYLYWR
uniref:Trichome birefringence-like N-terminal domain-containing protein n=2 Tax=Oryza TaxID=4527 RepID=A0A0D3GEL3_9ORYZ